MPGRKISPFHHISEENRRFQISHSVVLISTTYHQSLQQFYRPGLQCVTKGSSNTPFYSDSIGGTARCTAPPAIAALSSLSLPVIWLRREPVTRVIRILGTAETKLDTMEALRADCSHRAEPGAGGPGLDLMLNGNSAPPFSAGHGPKTQTQERLQAGCQKALIFRMNSS